MKTIIRILIITTLFTSSLKINAQNYLSNEDAFLYYMKVYNYQPRDNTNNREVNFGSLNWFTVYLMTYMPYEYNQVKDDEFKKRDFTKKANGIINSKLSNLDFNTTYIIDSDGSVGEYNFNSSSFSLNYTLDDFPRLVQNAKRLSIKIESIINIKDLENKIHLSSDKARNFISSRKSSNGNVDRRVYLRFYYNMTKRKSSSVGINGYDKQFVKIYVNKIEVYDNETRSNLLGTIKSKRDWIDKVNGQATNNGKNIYYYDRWWKEVETEGDSRYYTVVILKDGKHTNPVRTYYSRSKHVQSEANYNSVGTGKWRKADGLMKWYYYSGKLQQTVEIKNGKWHGTLKKWNKEKEYLEEVTDYKYGKKNGCSRLYNPDGSCRISWGSSVWVYYKNDKADYGNLSCTCEEQKKQTTSKKELSSHFKITKASDNTGDVNGNTFSQKYISPYVLNFETSNTIVRIKKANDFNGSQNDFIKIKDAIFKKMTSRLEKSSSLHFDNRTSISITVKKITFPFNEKRKNYSCMIDYKIRLTSNYSKPSTHRYTKISSMTAMTPIISLGYTKEGALTKASSNMVKKVNKFIVKHNPIGLEIQELELGSDGRVKKVIVKKDPKIKTILYNRDFNVVEKSNISQDFKVSGTIAKGIEYSGQTANTIIYTVKKTKYQKVLAKYVKRLNKLALVYQ